METRYLPTNAFVLLYLYFILLLFGIYLKLEETSLNSAGDSQNMLNAGMIVAGWDKHEGGVVYGLPLGGTIVKVPFTIGKS